MRNFMSVGNAPIELDLNQNSTTLITATNGSGKSSVMLDSITFALYGKAYRNINKPNLVNSINQKNCLLEIWFSVNTTKYYIKRGIRPHVFEIYKNDVLLNQDANIKDYQKTIEQQILRMNYRTFTQVVIMGSGNYVPFMRLPAAQRREFIEDLLDIKIFSVMNILLKDKIAITKDGLRDIEAEIKSVNDKIQMQQAFIFTLQEEKNNKIEDIQIEIDELQKEIAENSKKIQELQDNAATLLFNIKDVGKIKSKQQELTLIQEKLKDNIKKYEKDAKFFEDLETCPTCKQEITPDHKTHIIDRVNQKVEKLTDNIQEVNLKMADITDQIKSIEQMQIDLTILNNQISEFNNSINVANRVIQKHNNEISELMSNNTSIESERDNLKKLQRSKRTIEQKKKMLTEDRMYQDITAYLLKDTGIKTKVIRQYIPIINKLINRYLQQLDFFVMFNLDENFNEVIKSRYRDEFSYESFSEGEKQRIDLALLFTFREIARIKNSASVNLLLMDETLDQSLDSTGIDAFFTMLYDLKASNVFVISHRDNIQDKFKASVKLTKKNNFTVIAE